MQGLSTRALSAAFVAGALLAGGFVAAIGVPAAADSIQVQSYQRTNGDEQCAPQEGETPWQANWGSDSSWHPSWEQWANEGRGGPVCTRVIVWARTPVPAESESSGGGGAGGTCSTAATCSVGDIGPGGGLVFYKAGGVAYEMAPRTWGSGESGVAWCDVTTSLTTGTTVGTGAANTAAMLAGCSSGAASAATSYNGGGLTDWYVPSKDEYNAMCIYSRTLSSGDPTVLCTGGQDATFATGAYGFDSYAYWTSSQYESETTKSYFLNPGLSSPFWNIGVKTNALVRMRPIRSF